MLHKSIVLSSFSNPLLLHRKTISVSFYKPILYDTFQLKYIPHINSLIIYDNLAHMTGRILHCQNYVIYFKLRKHMQDTILYQIKIVRLNLNYLLTRRFSYGIICICFGKLERRNGKWSIQFLKQKTYLKKKDK